MLGDTPSASCMSTMLLVSGELVTLWWCDRGVDTGEESIRGNIEKIFIFPLFLLFVLILVQ